MADDTEKTEQPTARRRDEARQRGQIAKSQDLTAAVLLLVGLLTLDLFSGPLWDRLGSMSAFYLGGSGEMSVRASQLVPLSIGALTQAFSIMAPMLAIFFVAALVTAFMQTGFLFTAEPLRLNMERLNPIAGMKRLFSPHSVMVLLIHSVKMIVVVAVVYFSLAQDFDRVLFATNMVFTEMVRTGIEVFFRLGIRIAMVLIVLGVIDWFYQRQKHERSLRMTKQEIKEEMRRMEGDPLMKRRRREVQLQLAMQRLRYDVPKADVVVTNPTAIAVALKYDMETMNAPRVVAKGEGAVAQRIREIALEVGVPIVERKPLARALHQLVDVGQEIPPQLYKAVAEVLAYVYELSNRTRRQPASAAEVPV